MASSRQPVPLVAILVAILAGCGGSAAGNHPVIDPDVGTASPSSGPGSPAPRPTGAPTSGPVIRADRCPETFGQLQPANGPVSPPVTGPGTLGISTGARQALVCFYGPLSSSSPPTLRWTRTLDHFQAAAMLAVVDAKPQRETDLVGPVNCPMDNGSAAILRFSYATQPDQDVLVRMTGCRPAASEHGTTMFREDIARAVLALQAPVVQD